LLVLLTLPHIKIDFCISEENNVRHWIIEEVTLVPNFGKGLLENAFEHVQTEIYAEEVDVVGAGPDYYAHLSFTVEHNCIQFAALATLQLDFAHQTVALHVDHLNDWTLHTHKQVLLQKEVLLYYIVFIIIFIIFVVELNDFVDIMFVDH